MSARATTVINWLKRFWANDPTSHPFMATLTERSGVVNFESQ